MKFTIAMLLLLTQMRGSAQLPQLKEIDRALAALTKTTKAPGADVAIIKKGQVIYQRAYGYANLEFAVPNSSSTVFHIASLSKQFTALAVLLLANDGKLSLSDSINQYLPEMPVFGKPITILQLLNHTSGLREWIYLLGMQGHTLNEMFTQEQVIRVLSQQHSLNFQPGSQFMYVNSGYNLLARIVERVSGQSFSKFINDRIFTPLQMTHSFVSDNAENVIPNEAGSYIPSGRGRYTKKLLNFSNVVGSTGIKTTAGDLCKWADNFRMKKIGNSEIFRLMAQKGLLGNGDSISYAMGQSISNYKGYYTIDHSGSDAGFRSYLLRFPDMDLSIIILGNDGSMDAGKLAYQIADILLSTKSATVEKPNNITPTTGIPLTLERSILERYVGKYELRPNFLMDFFIEGNDLVVSATGQGKFVLLPIAPYKFQLRGVNGIITFPSSDTAKAAILDFEINGNRMQGKRVAEQIMTASDASKYTGEYYSNELGVAYTIAFENGKLMAKSNNSIKTELSPLSENTFSGREWFIGVLQFQKNEKAEIISFTISADRANNVLFEKR